MASLAGIPVDQSNINNLKDILMTYNRITEQCFVRCAANFNSRTLTNDEESCVSHCSSKMINSNQRLMGSFMEVQTKRQEAMVEEIETKAKEESESNMQLSQDSTPQVTEAKPTTTRDSLMKGMNMLFSIGKKREQDTVDQLSSVNLSSSDQDIQYTEHTESQSES